MNRAGQKRAFAILMMVAFIATCTLACAAALTQASDDDAPYSSSQQLPFEEKEFEDKDEADEKGSVFTVTLSFIHESKIFVPIDSVLAEVTTFKALRKLPLFLRHHTLLI